MNFKLLLGSVLTLIVLAFALQNTGMVTYQFFHWTLEAPRAAVVLAVFVAGLLLGWGLGSLGRRR